MKKIILIMMTLLVIAMFVVSGCAPGSFTGNAKAKPSVKKTAEKPFDVMQKSFTEMGLSEKQWWKYLESSNTILHDFKGDSQVEFALRQINNPTVDDKTKQASKEWIAAKINKNELYIPMTTEQLKGTAWLIVAEDSLKANILKLSSFSSELPLNPKKLKIIMDASGESMGGAKTPASGTPSPVKSESLAACVGSVSMKDVPKGRMSDDALFGKQKQSGGSVKDPGKDSTSTEAGGKAGSMEGQAKVMGMAGPCQGLKKDSGNGVISYQSPVATALSKNSVTAYDKNHQAESHIEITKVSYDGGKIFADYKIISNVGNVPGDDKGEIVAPKIVGQGELNADSSKQLEGRVNTKLDAEAERLKQEGYDKDVKKVPPETPPETTKEGNPLEGSDAPAAGSTDRCAQATNNCASSVDGDSPKQQLKKLAQDCQAESAKTKKSDSEMTGAVVKETTDEKGGSFSSPSQPAPGACDKVSPQCMNDLLKGPATDNGEDMSGACALSSNGALGFSEQAMFTDPVDLMGAAALAGQVSQAATAAKVGSATSKATTGTASTASTGASSGGANAAKAATGSGECVGDGCN